MPTKLLKTKPYNQIIELVKGYLNQYRQTNIANYEFKLVSPSFDIEKTPYLLNHPENNPGIKFDIFNDQQLLLTQVSIKEEIKFSHELPVDDWTMHQMLTKFKTWLQWWYQDQIGFLNAAFNRFKQWNLNCNQQLNHARFQLGQAIIKQQAQEELIVLPIENDTKVAICVKMNDANYEMVISLDGFGNIDLNAKLEIPAENQFDYQQWLSSYHLQTTFNQVVNQQRQISAL